MRRLITLLGAVAVLTSVGSAPARALSQAEALGGYTLLARSAAISYTYGSPGLLPTGETIFQATMPESTATLSSGPNGYALSSLAWPGPLLGDLGVIVEQSTAENQRPPFRIPAYPVRAEAFSPQGPATVERELVPGARMRAIAQGAATRATGQFSGMSIPVISEVGAITSDATSFLRGDQAVTQAVAKLSDVSLLAGLVTADSIVTTIESISDGENATSTASTKVAGLKFAGIAATVDEHGIRLDEQAAGGSDLTQLFTDNIPFGQITGGLSQATDPLSAGLRNALEQSQNGLDEFAAQSGIGIRLLPATTTINGALGEADAGGFQVRIFYDGKTTPVLSELLAAVPFQLLPGTYPDELPPQFPRPPLSPQALALLLRETHIQTITLGAANTSANATPAFTFDFGGMDDDLGPDFDLGGTGVLDDGFASFDPSPSGLTPSLAGGSNGGISGAGLSPSAPTPSRPISSGQPIPGAIAIVLVAGVPLFASWSRRLAAHSLAPPPS